MLKAGTMLFLVSALQIAVTSAFVDTDADGISDVWIRLYGAAELDADGDEDGDGISNAAESISGTDPFDPRSVAKVARIDRIGDGLLFRSKAVAGTKYRIEQGDLTDGGWTEIEHLSSDRDGEILAIVPRPPESKAFFRIAVNGAPIGSGLFIEEFRQDSDGDGHEDLAEFRAGTDPFGRDSKLRITDFRPGSGLSIQLQTVPGKRYQLQTFRISDGSWQNAGGAIVAKDSESTIWLEGGTSSQMVRFTITDIDSDGDGASDWDEIVTGFDPYLIQTSGDGTHDSDAIQKLLDEPVRYTLKARRPIAMLGSGEPGLVELRRVSGFGAASVSVSASGSARQGIDIGILPTAIVIPPGQRYALMPVEALPQAASEREIMLAIDNPAHVAEDSGSASVRTFLPVACSVKDFGAIGNGITDDRNSIQAAIDALESNPQVNTLYFPSGVYRLDSHISSLETPLGTRRILKLGNRDLSGRDIQIIGEKGSILRSTVSPTRAHMLVAMASFRSLEFRGLTFEKNDVPLSVGPAQGADGVSIVRVDKRDVRSVAFKDCVFSNCHGSVFVYGNGYDVRGKLNYLRFESCKVLNPYGTNTTAVATTWGGGQQISMGAWVGYASYVNCIFEGGGDDMTDHIRAPAGRLKDGCHFGSPLFLEFRNNLVTKMGIEAVYQLNQGTYMGTTEAGFTVPPADGVTPVIIKYKETPSTYIPGQLLNLRIPHGGTTAGKNNIFRVFDTNAGRRELTLVNDGEAGNDSPGTFLGHSLPIYLQTDQSGHAEIRDNILDGTLPPGAEISNPSGIVLDTKGIVRNNVILGFASGVHNYKEASVPLYPGTTGLVIDSNFIMMRHQDDSPGPATYGIQTHANEISIVRNQIASPVSRRSFGIALRGMNARVVSNRILALHQIVNGYESSQRAVGVLVGNTSYGTAVIGNTTQNFDVGVGPEPNQWIIHRVENHKSINDVYAVDFRGLENP
jgi:hypothetical protein